MHWRLLIAMIGLLLPLPAAAQLIKVAGSDTVGAYVELAAREYLRQHPGVHIEVAGGGSGSGVAMVRDGAVHIGMISRDLKPEEAASMPHVRAVAVGVDAVAVIVSSDIYENHGLHALTPAQLAAIYRGEVTNWKQLGGPDRQILVVDKKLEGGTRQTFAEYLLNDPFAASPTRAVVLRSSQHVRDLVRASDQAIGYVSLAEVGDDMHAVALEVDGRRVQPTRQALREGQYPLGRALYLLVPVEAPPYVSEFVNFLTSSEAEAILKRAGFNPPGW